MKNQKGQFFGWHKALSSICGCIAPLFHIFDLLETSDVRIFLEQVSNPIQMSTGLVPGSRLARSQVSNAIC